ncbi:MAG: glycerol acyltransferase, partial [Halioglobus sp.]|nr:glycerol acyltransferase [Halioglobus sp.]
MDDPFADIRPYRDEEVAGVLARLLDDRELLDTLAGFRLGRLARLAPALGRLLVRWRLAREVRGVADVGAMQAIIKRYMDRMIEDTTGGFSVTGLAQLDPARPYLYMSNHRDIAMDPAFINYALHRAGFQT